MLLFDLGLDNLFLHSCQVEEIVFGVLLQDNELVALCECLRVVLMFQDRLGIRNNELMRTLS